MTKYNSFFNVFLSGIFSGLLISLGSAVFLSLDSRIIGSIFLV